MKATIRIGLANALCLAVLAAAGVLAQSVPAPAPPTNVQVGTTLPPSLFPATGQRPYTFESPWNTPIPANAVEDSNSAAMIGTISGSLRSDPTQYTYPVYLADSTTPRVTMTCSGTASTINQDGTRTSSSQMSGVPIPASATASSGTDGQIVIIDRTTGDEYDIWQFTPPSSCVNMTKYAAGVYRTAAETTYISRGAGVPYFAGLVRPWEIAQGHIDHAIAFAYPSPRSTRCVYPASKTDGTSTGTYSIPEGARIQLDPAVDVNTISGLSAAGRVIARALQVYGAYLIDVSGSNKLYPESSITANWGTTVTATTVSAIPVGDLRVLKLPSAYWASTYTANYGKCVK